MAGLFTDAPHQVGWVLFGYSIILGTGVTAWSVVLPHMKMERALRVALVAMIRTCLGLHLFNYSQAEGASAGRGAAMGIYSVLLSLGAIVGSLLAGWLASLFVFDGLIYGTLAMAAIALLLVQGTGLGQQHDSRI
jgi:MFS family permease